MFITNCSGRLSDIVAYINEQLLCKVSEIGGRSSLKTLFDKSKLNHFICPKRSLNKFIIERTIDFSKLVEHVSFDHFLNGIAYYNILGSGFSDKTVQKYLRQGVEAETIKRIRLSRRCILYYVNIPRLIDCIDMSGLPKWQRALILRIREKTAFLENLPKEWEASVDEIEQIIQAAVEKGNKAKIQRKKRQQSATPTPAQEIEEHYKQSELYADGTRFFNSKKAYGQFKNFLSEYDLQEVALNRIKAAIDNWKGLRLFYVRGPKNITILPETPDFENFYKFKRQMIVGLDNYKQPKIVNMAEFSAQKNEKERADKEQAEAVETQLTIYWKQDLRYFESHGLPADLKFVDWKAYHVENSKLNLCKTVDGTYAWRVENLARGYWRMAANESRMQCGYGISEDDGELEGNLPFKVWQQFNPKIMTTIRKLADAGLPGK